MESTPGRAAGASLCEADVGTQSGTQLGGEVPAQGQGGGQGTHTESCVSDPGTKILR